MHICACMRGSEDFDGICWCLLPVIHSFGAFASFLPVLNCWRKHCCWVEKKWPSVDLFRCCQPLESKHTTFSPFLDTWRCWSRVDPRSGVIKSCWGFCATGKCRYELLLTSKAARNLWHSLQMLSRCFDSFLSNWTESLLKENALAFSKSGFYKYSYAFNFLKVCHLATTDYNAIYHNLKNCSQK